MEESNHNRDREPGAQEEHGAGGVRVTAGSQWPAEGHQGYEGGQRISEAAGDGASVRASCGHGQTFKQDKYFENSEKSQCIFARERNVLDVF